MNLLAQAGSVGERLGAPSGGVSGQSLGAPIEGIGPLGGQGMDLSSPGTAVAIFTSQLSNILGFFTLVGGTFFLIYFMIAGFDWLMAGGDTGKVDKAKSRMTNGAIGLMIMIVSVGIVGIIGGAFGLDILNPELIYQGLIP